jgi:general secretion pathway protein A
MYEAFYGLKERPFNLTPDPKFIYFTEKHCEGLANLVYGIRERKGFLVLSGEVGTGKTTLINALLDTFERTGVLSAFVFNPILTTSEFFEYLLADFNLKCDVRSKAQVLIALNALLLERYRMGRITVLVIDEAHDLSSEVLEEVRLLTNLETASEKLLQIILVGQPELSLRLNSPELRQLKQRVSLRCTLEPLTLAETNEYIRTRLEIAGLPNQDIFPGNTIAEIHHRASGIPRLINVICDNALLAGYACDTKQINADIVKEVSEGLELADKPRYLTTKAMAAQPDVGSPRNGTAGAVSGPTEGSEFGSDQSDSFDLFVQFVDKLRGRDKQRG